MFRSVFQSSYRASSAACTSLARAAPSTPHRRALVGNRPPIADSSGHRRVNYPHRAPIFGNNWARRRRTPHRAHGRHWAPCRGRAGRWQRTNGNEMNFRQNGQRRRRRRRWGAKFRPSSSCRRAAKNDRPANVYACPTALISCRLDYCNSRWTACLTASLRTCSKVTFALRRYIAANGDMLPSTAIYRHISP